MKFATLGMPDHGFAATFFVARVVRRQNDPNTEKTYECMCVCMTLYIYVCMYVCVYPCMYIYISVWVDVLRKVKFLICWDSGIQFLLDLDFTILDFKFAGGDRLAAWLSPTNFHAVDNDIAADHRDVPALVFISNF